MVSIIIPAIYSANSLHRLLSSFLQHNTHQPVELIIMDCGSTEHTEKMVSEFSARVFIRYIKISWTDLSSHKSRHNDNCPWDSSPCLSSSSALPGTAAGRDSGHQASVPDSDIAYILNRGAAKASQPYLLFLEPDLVYTWDVLSRAIKIMEENENVGLIAIPQDNNEGWLSLSKEAAVQRTGATFYCNENNAGWQVEEFCPARLKDYIDSPAAKPHQSIPAFSGTSLLCRKTDFDKLGGFSPADESPGIVADFCMRMARELGKKCIALKNTGVQVCQDSCHQHVSLWNFEHTSLQDILHSARRASKRKHWSSAATYWQYLLENHANKANTETFARAGQAQRQCGNFCAAEHILQQGLELHPDSLHLAQEYALTARDKKDWPQALLRWRMIIEHFQDKAPALAYSQLSKACRQLSKLDFAESTAEEGLSRYPDSMQLAMDYAEIAMSRRHWDTAVQRWQTILEQFGVNAGPRVFIRLAVAYRNMLDPGRAESIAENGLTAYPENMELLKIYSEIAMARRDWVQAVQRWQKVFDLFQQKPDLYKPARLLKGKVADWHLTDWGRLAEYLRRNQDLFDQLSDTFCLYLTDIMQHAGLLDDAQEFIKNCCAKSPDCMSLALKNAEIAMERQAWSQAAGYWQHVLARFGDELPAEVYAHLGLTYHMQKKYKAAQDIIHQGAARHPHLHGLDKEYTANDLALENFKSRPRKNSRISFKLITFDQDSTFYSQIRCGTYLDNKELSSCIQKYIPDKIGAINNTRAASNVCNIAARLCKRYAALYSSPPELPAQMLEDIIYYPLFTELCKLIPLRHLARKIAAANKNQPVFIELSSNVLTYLNYMKPSDLDLLYLYAELEKRGVNVFMCLQTDKLSQQCGLEQGPALKIMPSKELLKRTTLEPDPQDSALPKNKAIMPDNIRGIEKVVSYLNGAHILTTPYLVYSRPYSTRKKEPDINFTASLYSENVHLQSFIINLKHVQNLTSQSGYASGTSSIYETYEEYPANIFYWANYLLENFIKQLIHNAKNFLKYNSVQELHICDFFLLDTALLAHIVKQNNGKVILWPHSANPATFMHFHEKLVDKVYCMLQSGLSEWKKYYPNILLETKPELMLPSPGSPEIKAAVHDPGQQLSVVVISGGFFHGRLPLLQLNEHVQSCKRFLAKLKNISPAINLYFKKRSEDDHLFYLRDTAGNLENWQAALNHPLEIDYPNMIYVSVSFGSSSLFEGMSRGIPGMIVRDFQVQDYTLLDPRYVPTGTSDEIVNEIAACASYDYRMRLIERQMYYYRYETGYV